MVNRIDVIVSSTRQTAAFARGTRLLTPNGYVPVEAFKPGDPIISRWGIRRAVRGISYRDVEPLTGIGLQAGQGVGPVVVLAGAMGPGLPSRVVRLSPEHAFFIDGVLVPAMHLVNGATILREDRLGPMRYFHVILDRHDVVTAEGLAVESCTDIAVTKPCAPLVTAGPKLQQIRRRLHEITLQAGFTLRRDPGLRGVVGEAVLEPAMRQVAAVQMARFTLPVNAGRMLLLARSAAPAETDPDSADRRALAICLRQPRAKRRQLQLGQGWHDPLAGDPGLWMGGSAEILLPPGATELTLQLTAVAQHWRRVPAG